MDKESKIQVNQQQFKKGQNKEKKDNSKKWKKFNILGPQNIWSIWITR